ncbi:MAG: primosomal protein N' (replication factor Y) - superfamily II helicase [Gemmatimonadaceae bacterium]|nr:primosomal protein N' (replication factor Y) - superfamily II helicase [Gemmatimonadaceae bacterium]
MSEKTTVVSEDAAVNPAPAEPTTGGGRVFPCQQCGASLRFAPSVGTLTCPSCGTENARPVTDDLQRAAAHEELDYQAHLRAQLGNEPHIRPQLVDCPQCGAQTQFDAHVVASVCAFCATPLVATSAHAERRIRPRGVVPFALEPKAAQSLFQRWISGLWFAPNALKDTVRSAQGVRGVYLPCWTFDAQTTSTYTGQRGINRTVRETRQDANGRTVEVTRIETDWYYASGTVHVAFDDTLVPASHSIPEHLTKVLHGWDISGMQPYSDDYIAGFTVEAYQVALEPAFGEATAVFQGGIHSAVCQDIGGDQQRVHGVNTQYDAVTFKHILLPAWVASYQYGGKTWRVVVNGQTGDVVGDRPWSAWKIAFAVLGVAAVIGALYLLNS